MIRSSHGVTPSGPKRGAPKGGAKLPSPRRAEAPAGGAAPSRREERPRSRREGEEGGRLKKTKGLPPEARSLSSSARVPPGVSTASDDAREVAILVAVAAIEKKASGLEVIDVSGRVDYADFLVLMSGRSDRHVTALSSAIEEALRKRNKRALAVEGLPHASWVLMDFGDVVVHVFQDDARAAYDIDGLWMDARRVPVPISEPPPQPRA
jgi:ribosome-associated protein